MIKRRHREEDWVANRRQERKNPFVSADRGRYTSGQLRLHRGGPTLTFCRAYILILPNILLTSHNSRVISRAVARGGEAGGQCLPRHGLAPPPRRLGEFLKFVYYCWIKKKMNTDFIFTCTRKVKMVINL